MQGKMKCRDLARSQNHRNKNAFSVRLLVMFASSTEWGPKIKFQITVLVL